MLYHPPMRLLICLAILSTCLLGCATPPGRERRDPNHTGLCFRSVNVAGIARDYALYIPRACTPDKAWPCVIFLNGSGECGTDGQRLLTQGLFPAMINAPGDWPLIAIFPQKPDRASSWLDHDELVLATLTQTQREVSIDPTRIYLTGLSQGGAGTWAIAAKHPTLFAAIAPVCGYGDPTALGDSLNTMPVWAMHGEIDAVVPIAQTQRLIEAVQASSGRGIELNPPSGASLIPGTKSDLRFTRFPDLNHGCWDRAYRDMELGEWLLSFRK